LEAGLGSGSCNEAERAPKQLTKRELKRGWQG
jgi:hypothetical protein